MATHSSILVWKIPRTELEATEPGRLYSPCGNKELDTTEKLNIITASIIIYYLVLLYLVIHNVLIMF